MPSEDIKQELEERSTQCDHTYVSVGEENGLQTVSCTKCWHGMNISPDLEIKEGKIQW